MSHRTVPMPLPRGERATLAKVVGLFCLLSFWLTITYSGFKILTYSIPFFALIAVLSQGKFTFTSNALPYFVLMLGGVAMAPLATLYGWQDLYIMLMGLSPFFFGYQYRTTWQQVFLATLFSTIIIVALARSGHGAATGLEFDVATSKSSFESPTCFIFGILAMWAALERRWKNTLLALLLCVLTLKRIVVLAVFVSVFMTLLPRAFVDRLLKPLPMLVLNALFIFIVVLYAQGNLDNFIQSFTRQSSNQLGMGRQALYQHPVAALMQEPYRFMLYGRGAGSIYSIITGGFALGKPNLHNDSLKILIEYGGLVWISFFVALYINPDFRIRILMLFLNILFLTDNTLIYGYLIFATGLAIMNLKRIEVTPRVVKRSKWSYAKQVEVKPSVRTSDL